MPNGNGTDGCIDQAAEALPQGAVTPVLPAPQQQPAIPSPPLAQPPEPPVHTPFIPPVPSTSREQHPDVLLLGEHMYPPLMIREEPDPQHPNTELVAPINFNYFVFLTAFQESFNARWQEGERSYGRLNPMYYYGGTDREASMSFTLPALTVQESEQNLHKCSELARAVYGQYREWQLSSDEVKDFTMIGHRYFRVNFGNLIMNERVFISGFTFNINPDAGVFDYSPASAAEALRRITSGRRNEAVNDESGQVLPRQIDIQISMIFRHDYPLGFGGPNRVGHPDKWASNKDRDFPHGTSKNPRGYMRYTGGTATAVRTAAQAHSEMVTTQCEDAVAHFQDDEMQAEWRRVMGDQPAEIVLGNGTVCETPED